MRRVPAPRGPQRPPRRQHCASMLRAGFEENTSCLVTAERPCRSGRARAARVGTRTATTRAYAAVTRPRTRNRYCQPRSPPRPSSSSRPAATGAPSTCVSEPQGPGAWKGILLLRPHTPAWRQGRRAFDRKPRASCSRQHHAAVTMPQTVPACGPAHVSQEMKDVRPSRVSADGADSRPPSSSRANRDSVARQRAAPSERPRLRDGGGGARRSPWDADLARRVEERHVAPDGWRARRPAQHAGRLCRHGRQSCTA